MRCEPSEYSLGNSLFIKDAAELMLVGHFLSWMWCLYTYLHLAQSLRSSEAVILLVVLLLCGIAIASALYGITVSCDVYFQPFIVLQYVGYCSILVYGLPHFNIYSTTGLRYYLQIVYLCALTCGLYYCVSVSKAYIAYVRNLRAKNALFNKKSADVYTLPIIIDVLSPSNECAESNRGSIISDTLIDDIFSDYDDFVI